MICEYCRRSQHERCAGCTCQHKTPQTPPPGGDDPAPSPAQQEAGHA